MARDISNLREYDLKGKRNIVILVGCFFKAEFHGVINGKQVDTENTYFIHYFSNTDLTKGVFGSTVNTVLMNEEVFKQTFGNEDNFLNDWIFRPVLPFISKNVKGVDTMGACFKSPEFNHISGGEKK